MFASIVVVVNTYLINIVIARILEDIV